MDEVVRVVHVDDEPTIGELVSDFLEREDDRIEVLTETSAGDGISRIKSEAESIDCIVSDYDMPGMDGLEFLDVLREEYPDLPFILYTGKGSEKVASEAISKGASDYLQKGSGTEQYELLANRIRNAVEQFRSLRRAEKYERITRVIQDINRALVYADSTDDIEQQVCETLSDAEPYVTACIAGVDSETMQIEPRTWAGDAAGYFEQLNMSVDDESPGRNAPGGRAFHDRELAISQNIPEDPQYENWREAATKRNFQSLAILPLEYESKLYGLLALFADRPFAFDETEQDMLTELGDDIAHALHAQEMQAELRQTASRLEALFARSPDMINIHDLEGNILNPNPHLCKKTGYSESELAEMKVWDLDRNIDPNVGDSIWEEMDIGDSQRLEGQYQRKDGSTFPVEVHIRRLDFDGEDQFIAISRDVSGRKRRVRELERYERIIENLPVGVFRTAESGEFVSMNPEYVSICDAESAEDVADIEATELWADSDERDALLNRFEEEDVVKEQAVEVETFDGETKVIETTLALTEEDGTQYLDGIARDVTDSRQREQRFEQAETLFENAQDALFLIDVSDDQYAIERVNPAYERATGLDSDELHGKTPRDILGDEAGSEVEAMYRTCIDQCESIKYEEELPINGELTYWETRIAPVTIDDEVEKLVGATRNITDRKERERKLELIETLFEHTGECQFIVDVADGDFKLRHANEYYKQIAGLPPDEPVTGQTPTDLFGETGGQEVLDRYMECVETRESVTYAVELPVPEEGTVYRTILTPVVTDDELTHIVGAARDITELREREQELQEERAFIDQSLNALEDVFYVFSADREILRWNDRLSEVTGYPDEEITGMESTDFFPEDHQPRVADAVTEIMETGNTTVQADFLTTDGERIPHEFTGFRLTDTDGEVLGFAGIGRDLRRQREYERQLEQRNERLEEFTGIVSHDLRNPLTMADGRLELAREECESEHLGEVQRALDRMDALIGDLLTLAHGGKTVTDLEPIDLAAIVERCWTNVDTRDATLVTDIGRTIHADESRLKQVFENLVRNAVEHGGGEVTVTVGELDGGFYVEDDGPGIPEDERNDVFDAGYTTTDEGTGFGLSIVKQVVDAHDWEIRMTEGTGGGARFEIIGLEFK